MFIKVGVILLYLCIAVAQMENSEWDLAVAISDQVELLYSNGSLLGSPGQQFSKLKALTFDYIRHQFVVSDVNQQNDTIYSVQLTKQTDKTPIVQDLPDNVQGLAIDPITDILYWSDPERGTINYVSLNDSMHSSNVLFQFENENPQDIAIDVCRRYIYWTNSDITNPTIERATLDGDKREVLISDDLFMPSGIVVDHIARRIFWADKREGIYYRIESAKLDGSQRQLVFEGTHQRPFGIAVDKDSVYWTDVNNNALWKKNKNENEQPKKLRHFTENPMGLVSKHLNIQNISECSNFLDAWETYNGSSTEYFEEFSYDKEIVECLNGDIVNDECQCKRGFTGTKCEIPVCYNFCVHGNCHFTSTGIKQCHCPKGYIGTRCEKDVCDGFCLNEGKCVRSQNYSLGISCQCPERFIGRRCEISLNLDDLCNNFCKRGQSDILTDQKNTFTCRCDQNSYKLSEHADSLMAYELISAENGSRLTIFNYFQDPIFIILATLMLTMVVIVVILSACICRLRRRPRINKRIVVNKNITPLTYRPQPISQQCEITIENCCNMNVCDTPCFEPAQFRGFQTSRKDEKKTLLSNMENGEDLY